MFKKNTQLVQFFSSSCMNIIIKLENNESFTGIKGNVEV